MPDLVLGVSGSVACYRAADLARELMREGFSVRVCLTDSAARFVSPALFEALTGQPCLSDVFEEPERGRMAHIDWARSAAALVVAPATANTLSRLAHGLGDDMLTTIALAFEGPLVLAPAMNPAMYDHETTREALDRLTERGAWVVEPAEGEVACGEQGQGKLASIPEIVAAVLEATAHGSSLAGRHVLLTSGPTQEPIDDVRFLSNRSSGKMGAALARAALQMGARVTVVSGPVALGYPPQAEVVRVRTALEMLEAALSHVAQADLIVGVAAVADYRPAQRAPGKLRRQADTMALDLVANPDVIATLAGRAKPGALCVAFAAEPGEGLGPAYAKLKAKGVRAVAVNDVSQPGLGMEADENALTLVTESGEVASGRMSKSRLARWLLERLAGELG